MSLGGGDKLASGAPRAQFNPATVSDEKFAEMFGEEALRKLNNMSEADRLRLEEEAKAEVAKLETPVQSGPVTIRAVQDRIWVTRYEEPDKVNGLFLPDEGKEKPAKGIVVAVGPGKYVDGNLQVPSIKVGDKVVFGKFAGAEVQIGLGHYLVLREEDVFGIELDVEESI